jgi:hypothetical protein
MTVPTKYISNYSRHRIINMAMSGKSADKIATELSLPHYRVKEVIDVYNKK